MWQIVAPGRILLSYGPVELTILAEKNGQGMNELAILGAETVPELLRDLTLYREQFKQSYLQLTITKDDPEIVQKMYNSVAALQDSSFTPMAAVAGSIAGIVADRIFTAGASKVVVNNGGDIAIRLQPGERTIVGLAPSIENQNPTHSLLVTSESGIQGVSTSGLGGRSFTKGIASAAVAISYDSGIADATATFLGNLTYSPDPQIEQVFAEEIYPDTDLVGHKIIKTVGELSAETKKLALKNGMLAAQMLFRQGLILGAVIFVQDFYAMIPKNFAQTLQNRNFHF